ncbi:unnamed protein product [Auanema sp. JU1783]|nr:unnamed protein product [Auanema sp. JU1783]
MLFSNSSSILLIFILTTVLSTQGAYINKPATNKLRDANNSTSEKGVTYNDNDLACPTIGTNSFILVTISEDLESTAFYELLLFYSKLMPINETITYTFYFGNTTTLTIETKNLQEEVDDWKTDTPYFLKLFLASRINCENNINNCTDFTQIMRNIYHLVDNQNQQPLTAIKKKQIVILTNYVPLSAINFMNTYNATDVQLAGLTYSLDVESFQNVSNFPVFGAYDGDGEIWPLRRFFQGELQFQFPLVRQDKVISLNFIYLSSLQSEKDVLLELVSSIIYGSMCSLSDNKMYQEYIYLSFPYNDTMHTMTLPWVGDESHKFLSNCIKHLPHEVHSNSSCLPAADQIYQAFVAEATLPRPGNRSFVSLISNEPSCAASHIIGIGAQVPSTTYARIILAGDLEDSYSSIIKPLTDDGYMSDTVDNQIISQTSFYLTNYTTTCTTRIPLVPLISSHPYHRPKYLRFALDDMLWITICSTISVTTFGVILYMNVKRSQKKQMALLTEIMMSPRLYKMAIDDSKTVRLPWEIKADRVYIDKEFMLGEGTVSNVYLGKLKGKAPIMQWLDNRVELRQYQDCAVAVRVPFHFDEPEEDQLYREINSMKRLRSHDHIALLLGWTNKNDLICSVLELTHMNLIKYLGQILETMGPQSEEKYMPYQVIYKIIIEVADGMAFIQSRNLVHRDLTARNVLLTTGLRAKISGFGFCSEPDDPKFAQNAIAFRFLPVRWMAPECFKGKFVLKSDVWSFAVLLYEIFSLGNVPYPDVGNPEDIIKSVTHGTIPLCPKFANRQIYKIMQSCFKMFSDRRPNFSQLKELISLEAESFYDNQAFEPE